MGGRRRRSQWVSVSLAMRGAGKKMRAGSRDKSVSRGGERICCIRSGIGEFCQDGVFSSQDQGVTTEHDRSRSLGGPGVNPFHSKEEAVISAVFAGGRCWLREKQKYETSVPWERHRQRGSGSQRPKEVIWWV